MIYARPEKKLTIVCFIRNPSAAAGEQFFSPNSRASMWLHPLNCSLVLKTWIAPWFQLHFVVRMENRLKPFEGPEKSFFRFCTIIKVDKDTDDVSYNQHLSVHFSLHINLIWNRTYITDSCLLSLVFKKLKWVSLIVENLKINLMV